jgi:hypothetical protein
MPSYVFYKTFDNNQKDYNQMMSDLNQNTYLLSQYASELDDIIQDPNATNYPPFPTQRVLSNEYKKALDKSKESDDKTSLDVSNDDTYNLIIQQNTMYIFGSLACASLLIASIFIGKQ